MTSQTARMELPGKAAQSFFRVVCTPAVPQHIELVSSLTGFGMITSRFGDPGFVIMDVRTPPIYAVGHIRGAINLDFYSSTFNADLARLNRCHAYMVYCASGNRSRQTVQRMKDLGFLEVYDLGGFANFTRVPGSEAWIE